jgi:hypothetical protein
MGDVRVCGKPCHNAKHAKCVCWCCGMFHGKPGEDARDAFAEAFGEKFNADPEQKPMLGLDRLRGALERRADELGSLHVREPYHRWAFAEGA